MVIGPCLILFLSHLTGLDPLLSRREFLSYCLSLMRSHNAEHLDSLPVLDVSALKHIAYVFDALIYYMRSGVDSPVTPEVIREPLEPWNDQVCGLLELVTCKPILFAQITLLFEYVSSIFLTG